MQKLALFLVTIFLFLLLPHQAKAAEDWQINSFLSNINLLNTGRVEVTEIIEVDFGLTAHHGIFRNIPYLYRLADGQTLYSLVTVNSVLQDGQEAVAINYQDQRYKIIKIGDPTKTISGQHTYTINYTISGVLRSFEDHDELYWDVTGDGWPVPIKKVTAVVRLPASGLIKVDCFEGKFGSTKRCTGQIADQKQANFLNVSALKPNENLTLVVGYQKGLVPVISLPSPSKAATIVSTNPSYDLRPTPPNLNLSILAFFLGFSLLIAWWLKNGRDLWWQRPQPTPEDQGQVVPLGTPEVVTVEYQPPNNLRPAEIGTLVDERADTLDVSATIVDLAVRGYLTINEIPKTWWLGQTDYEFNQTKKDIKGLLRFEQVLLSKIFKTSTSIKLSELKLVFYDDLLLVKQELYDNLVEKKFFTDNPDLVRGKYIATGIGLLIVSVMLTVFGFLASVSAFSGFGIGLAASSVFLIILANFMPRRTALGHQLYLRSLGYKLFISKVEVYRQRFFEQKNLFNEILPYAIVFGQTKKLAQAMKDLGIQPTQPSWYVGTRPFDVYYFGSSVASFSDTITAAIATQPSSGSFASGGSGFGGGFGGGFSGGGFGGGGGGAW